MKKLIILVLIAVVGFAGYLFAQDEIQTLRNQRNQVSVAIIQLQAQRQFLIDQLVQYLDQYYTNKLGIDDRLNQLGGQIGKIDKQIAGLEKEEPISSKEESK